MHHLTSSLNPQARLQVQFLPILIHFSLLLEQFLKDPQVNIKIPHYEFS